MPADGAERVVHELSLSATAPRRPSPRATRLLMVAAAVAVVLGGIAVSMHRQRHFRVADRRGRRVPSRAPESRRRPPCGGRHAGDRSGRQRRGERRQGHPRRAGRRRTDRRARPAGASGRRGHSRCGRRHRQSRIDRQRRRADRPARSDRRGRWHRCDLAPFPQDRRAPGSGRQREDHQERLARSAGAARPAPGRGEPGHERRGRARRATSPTATRASAATTRPRRSRSGCRRPTSRRPSRGSLDSAT